MYYFYRNSFTNFEIGYLFSISLHRNDCLYHYRTKKFRENKKKKKANSFCQFSPFQNRFNKNLKVHKMLDSDFYLLDHLVNVIQLTRVY